MYLYFLIRSILLMDTVGYWILHFCNQCKISNFVHDVNFIVPLFSKLFLQNVFQKLTTYLKLFDTINWPKRKISFCFSFPLIGHLCKFTVSFCECESEPSTLLKYGLWPATPSEPQTAFSISLLELFHNLSLECQVSVEGFSNTLRWKNFITRVEVNVLMSFFKCMLTQYPAEL